ncbi:MAG: hypothetical protein M1815_004654 [Lichina confinis]|nr:MAG: hypothetical protein M1815_004654 [Lichina confinis]
MAFPGPPGGPSQPFSQAAFATLSSSSAASTSNGPAETAPFDVLEWYPSYQNCQRYFLDTAQHQDMVKAMAAFMNIHLPCQKHPNPIVAFAPSPTTATTRPPQPGMSWAPGWGGGASTNTSTGSSSWVSLIPYLRRLVVTGSDLPTILHGFFGDDWVKGVGLLHEQERRNYLFAAKSEGWASVKKGYDMSAEETVPFLRPLRQPLDAEIQMAEKTWSEWLAMEDWMVGPRAPEHMRDAPAARSQHR